VRLFGDSIPVRLRSTSLGLVGVVGATALAVVGLTLQHGAPVVSSGPIHVPVESAVGPGRALVDRSAEAAPRRATPPAEEAPVRVSRPLAEDEPASPAPPPAPAPVVPDAEPGRIGGGDERGAPPGKAHVEPGPEPAPVPAPAAPPEPVATPSSEAPEPAPAPPLEEPESGPGGGHAHGRGSGRGPGGAGPPGLAKK
jgi:hypothetical protein